MPDVPALSDRSPFLRQNRFQLIAFAAAVALGLAIIVNVQLEGDAMWFWLATLVHHGTRLYRDLHFPLPPFFILLNDAWMVVFGRKTLAYESLSVVCMVGQVIGMWLLLRESEWPDWLKALLLFSSSAVIVFVNAYRFDDFHTICDCCALYTLLLLLYLQRASGMARQLALAAMLGVLAGIATTTHITDGAALIVSGAFCATYLAPKRRAAILAVLLAGVIVTFVVVVLLTGDSLHDYFAATVFQAAKAKGGTGSVLHGPWFAFKDNVRHLIRFDRKTLWPAVLLLALGAWLMRRRPVPQVLGVQVGLALAAVVVAGSAVRFHMLQEGGIVEPFSALAQTLAYVFAVLVGYRFFRYLRSGPTAWDRREVLIYVALGTLLSASVSQVQGTSNSFVTFAVMILLGAVLWPYPSAPSWAVGTYASVCLLAAISATGYKIHEPYAWRINNALPMFTGRVWYQHPQLGWMYLRQDELNFYRPICAKVRAGDRPPTLLASPFPYPNYFCAVEPWHGYVETWFDLSTRDTIEKLILELNTAPPRWILYERQMKRLSDNEEEFNHKQPLPHRKLDAFLMSKLASGQWKLQDETRGATGDGWYFIRTDAP